VNRRVLVPGLGRRVGLIVAIAAIVVQVIVLAAGAWAVANRSIVRDWLVVGKVIETETLASYVDDAGLSQQGRFYLYAAKPILHTIDTFNESCPAKEQGVAVLGCYIGKDDRIHLLDITDETFSVMEPVVAAHEMLHAVWARFDDAERERVGAAVEASYADITDPVVRERVNVYLDENGDIPVSELFAILGTEVPIVNNELTAVYDRYFDRRGACVALAAEASSVITTIVSEIERVGKELVALQAEIDAARAAYDAETTSLNSAIERFNANSNTAGYYTSQTTFERDRAALTTRREALEVQRTNLNASVDEFNVLVEQLDLLNSQAMALNKALGIDVSDMSPVSAD